MILFFVPEVQGSLHFCTQLSLSLPCPAAACRRAQRRGQVTACGGRKAAGWLGGRSWRCDVRAQMNSGHAREMFPAGRWVAWNDVALLLLMPHSCFLVLPQCFCFWSVWVWLHCKKSRERRTLCPSKTNVGFHNKSPILEIRNGKIWAHIDGVHADQPEGEWIKEMYLKIVLKD